MSDWQRQIVMGTVLGGSSLVVPTRGRSAYLAMRDRQRHWLAYKCAELEAFAGEKPFYEDGATLRWFSACYPVFREVRDEMYDGKRRRITSRLLDRLRDIGLAVWFGDCGRLRGGKVVLATSVLGDVGTAVAANWFADVGIGRPDIRHGKQGLRLLFDTAASEQFLMLVASRLPERFLTDLFA